ncbi:TPA: hypothetical protein N0F65_009385 [Lagenidium giganteum]|uniref:Uncharacterized protein n=1 Tax=Lagenidium giganteum TaxID=4803 RepID=A0AAV2ZGB9_9STRA|nr:TPA: hypothetical protein N0F65_009385 [Lagenidium giganteum]
MMSAHRAVFHLELVTDPDARPHPDLAVQQHMCNASSFTIELFWRLDWKTHLRHQLDAIRQQINVGTEQLGSCRGQLKQASVTSAPCASAPSCIASST